MTRKILFSITLMFSLSVSAMVPLSIQYEFAEGRSFIITEKTGIEITGMDLWNVARGFAESVEQITGYDIGEIRRMRSRIHLGLNGNMGHDEYFIKINEKTASVYGGSTVAIQYGLNTVMQYINYDSTANIISLPVSIIEDKPYLTLRCAESNYIPKSASVDEISVLMRRLSFLKMNALLCSADQVSLLDSIAMRNNIMLIPEVHDLDDFNVALDAYNSDFIVVNSIVDDLLATIQKSGRRPLVKRRIMSNEGVEYYSLMDYTADNSLIAEIDSVSKKTLYNIFKDYVAVKPVGMVLKCVDIDTYMDMLPLAAEAFWSLPDLKNYDDFQYRAKELGLLMSELYFQRISGLR